MTKAISIEVPSRSSRIVVIRSTESTEVVAHGSSLKAVLAKARKAGATEPVVFFVPKPGKRYIY